MRPLTKEELEFVDKVKGHKIRGTDWSTNCYFVPDGHCKNEHGNTIIRGDVYRSGRDELLESEHWFAMGSGFAPSHLSWHYIYSIDDVPFNNITLERKCICGEEKSRKLGATGGKHSTWCKIKEKE